MHLVYVAMLGVVLALFAVGAVLIFRLVWTGPSTLRTAAINGVLVFFSLCFTLVLLEGAIYQFVAYSDAYTISLAHKRWQAKYWHPINSLALRGPEPECQPAGGPPTLLVVGDSFTEGAGLEDYRSRFSEQLKPLLSGRWHVETLARAGWDTPTQTHQLKQFPCEPDRVLLAYFVNDIKTAANAAGKELGKAPPLSPTLAFVLNHSHLINFAYYRIYRFLNGFFAKPINLFVEVYDDPAIWQAHEKEMDAFIAACRERGAELEVMIFPDLNSLDGTRPVTEKVQTAFEERGVRVLNLSGLLAGRRPREMVVNPVDSHPNPALHAEVAREMVRYFGW